MTIKTKNRITIAIFFPIFIAIMGAAFAIIGWAEQDAEAAISSGSSILELTPEQITPTCEQVREKKNQFEQMLTNNTHHLKILEEIAVDVSATTINRKPEKLETMAFVITTLRQTIKMGRSVIQQVENDEKIYCPQ